MTSNYCCDYNCGFRIVSSYYFICSFWLVVWWVVGWGYGGLGVQSITDLQPQLKQYLQR